MSMSDSALICYRRSPGDELFFAINDSEEIYCFSTDKDEELPGYYVAHYLTEAIAEAIAETCAKRTSPTNTNGPGAMWHWDLDQDEELVIQCCRDFSKALQDFVDHRLDVNCGKECAICNVATDEEEYGYVDDYGEVWCHECCCGRYCECCEGHFHDEHDITYVSETAESIGHTGMNEGNVCQDCLDLNYEEWGVCRWDEQNQETVAEEMGTRRGREWMDANPRCKPDPSISDIHRMNAETFYDEGGCEDEVGYEWESPCLRDIFAENWVHECVTDRTPPPDQVEPPDPNQLTIADSEQAKPEYVGIMANLASVLKQAERVKREEARIAAARRESHKNVDLGTLVSGLVSSMGADHPDYIPI